MTTKQVLFGSGVLWARPMTDAYGNAIANPTPVKFGMLQDVAIDVSWDVKLGYGQNQFALLAARGKGKATAKAKLLQANGALVNSLVFGQTLATGQIIDYSDNTGQAVPATPFTITIVPPTGGTYVKDLGVRYVSTGAILTRVAATPTVGQYTVNEATGAYVFAAADTLANVFIDYQYSTTTGGFKISVANPIMGAAPTFGIDFEGTYQGATAILSATNCTCNKLSIATKLDDYTIPEVDIDILADPNTGLPFTWSFAA